MIASLLLNAQRDTSHAFSQHDLTARSRFQLRSAAYTKLNTRIQSYSKIAQVE